MLYSWLMGVPINTIKGLEKNVGKDFEKKKPLYTVGGNVN